VLPVRENVYMLSHAGENIVVLVPARRPLESHEGSVNQLRGVLIVNTGLADFAADVLAEVRRLSPEPIRFIVNTHYAADSVGGNERLQAANQAAIIAHQNVLSRMSARGSPFESTSDAWPSDPLEVKRAFRFNDEAIEVVHQPAAHTDGDSIVVFRRSDVISTGDVFNTDRFPVFDPERGGSINGVLDALNNILDVAVFGDRVEDGTLIVPGHGRLSDYADVNEYRNMVTIIRDRVRDLVAKDNTLEQVTAARPAREFDRRYSTPSWTTDMFVAAVYEDLKKEGQPR
jgi:glyoxylase-like metal-dependent hydrolase (beta-lactamase superfamily II)